MLAVTTEKPWKLSSLYKELMWTGLCPPCCVHISGEHQASRRIHTKEGQEEAPDFTNSRAQHPGLEQGPWHQLNQGDWDLEAWTEA